jgi:hypothetical protein
VAAGLEQRCRDTLRAARRCSLGDAPVLARIGGAGMTTDEPVRRPLPKLPRIVRAIAPTSRINVAFPFSRIQTEEPSRELAELAEVVAELIVHVEAVAPGPKVERLHERAQALAARLR